MLKRIMIFIFFTGGGIFAQTGLTVNLSDGTTQTFTIEEISSITFSGITDVKDYEELSGILSQFRVYQNYPNPFSKGVDGNPSTAIRYNLPQAGNVVVNIFNINGKLVRTVKNNYEKKGMHIAFWNGNNSAGNRAASGIYIYQIIFNEQMISKKMLLIK